LEAGISQPDEMQRLQSIINPTYGILTGIGTAHQENFQSLRQKLREKLRLFQNCRALILQADEPWILETLAEAG
jgi:UDP-N-acetylmuramyl pentapeptide synthase